MTTTSRMLGAPRVLLPARGAINVAHAPYNAPADGVRDASRAFQMAFQDAADMGGADVYAPAGAYVVRDVRWLSDGTRLVGDGRHATRIITPDGYAFRNHANSDSDSGGTFIRCAVARVGFWGGVIIADRAFGAANGIAKPHATNNLNGAFRLKEVQFWRFDDCLFSNFHRAIDQYAGIETQVKRCVFQESGIGHRLENGVTWGVPAYKNTTMTWEHNRFRFCWVGVWAEDLVDRSASRDNVYEPCNTGLYMLNGGSQVELSDYFEAGYEGYVLDGGFFLDATIKRPIYYSMGGGAAVRIGAALSQSASVRIISERSSGALGAGGLMFDAPRGKIHIDRPLTDVPLVPNVYVRSVRNRGLFADPKFQRGAVQVDGGAGILAPSLATDANGDTVLRLQGTNDGIAWNGARMLLLPFGYDGPLRVRFDYRYTGTSVNFRPFGVNLGAPFSAAFGPLVAGDTGGKWLAFEGTVSDGSPLVNAFAQGGFNGLVEIKNVYVSNGWGLAESYEYAADNLYTDDKPPTRGTWYKGERVWNYQQGAGHAVGWTCTAGGTPGTWLPMAVIAGSATKGDASFTLTAFADASTVLVTAALTANRTATLAGGAVGARFRVVRTAAATGAFTLDVGGLKTLSAAGQWCEVEHDGAAWKLIGYGTL